MEGRRNETYSPFLCSRLRSVFFSQTSVFLLVVTYYIQNHEIMSEISILMRLSKDKISLRWGGKKHTFRYRFKVR